MKVTAFDFWDTERTLGIELDTDKLEIPEFKLKKNEMFVHDDVTYMITKVFRKKSMGPDKLIETRVVKYKVPNTVSTHVHKCPAKLVQMSEITVEQRKKMVKQYGEVTVNGWQQQGRVKLKLDTLAHQCPGCKVVYYKEKNLLPDSVKVTSTKGKRKLKSRKK